MSVLLPKKNYRASTFKPETSRAAWQTALARLPITHALQSWTWGTFKSRWGWSVHPQLLTIAEGSWEPLAAALVLKRSIPWTPFCMLYVPKGPLLDYGDAALREQVLAQLEKLARRHRALFIKIDPDVVLAWGLDGERPSPTGRRFVEQLKKRGWRISAEQIQFKNSVQLDLTQSEEELLAAMKQKTRYNIRLASRKGIEIRHGSATDFDAIARMYRETAARDGFAIRPLAYYLDIWHAFYDDGMAHPLVAEFGGNAVAAVILITFGDTATYMYGASTSAERNRMPTYLLQWEAIRWAKAEGYKTYDFWGAPDAFDESDRMWGVWRFKAGFNGEVVRHIGAWDFAVRPLLYWFYSIALPKYVNYLKSRR